jgi:hypothetical protein
MSASQNTRSPIVAYGTRLGGAQLRAITLIVAGLTFASLAMLLVRGAFPTPFSDEFYFFRLYLDAKGGSLDFKEVIQPHFGHIYVLLKSWFWLVVHYQIDWRVSMYVQAALVAAAVAFLANYAGNRMMPKAGLLVILAIALALASARQAENLYWAIQVSAAAMLMFTILAFYWIEKYMTSQATAHAAVALAFALLALLSNGGGLVSFSIAIAAIIVYTRRNWLRISYALMALVFLAGMLSLFKTQGPPDQSLLNLSSVFSYFLAFFANALYSFSMRGDDAYSLAIGTAILMCTAFAIKEFLRDQKRYLFPALLMAFSLASCLLIAYARLKGGIWQPNASRYYPFAAMILVGNLLIFGQSGKRSGQYLVLALFFAVSISAAKSYYAEWHTSPYRYTNFKDAHLKLCSGSRDGLAFNGDLNYTDTGVLKEIFCSNTELSQIELKSQPVLLEFGPDQTKAKEMFNLQPSGESALWIRTENCESSCKLLFAGVEIPSVANETGTLVTAAIPRDLYASPGDKTVQLENALSGKKSRIAVFRVH